MGHANGIPLASHDDETTDHITLASSEGVVISEFPTTFEAAEAARAHGLSILMGSPNIIRGGSHTGNVGAADLARRGLLDIVSSDYVPISLLQSAFALTAEDIGYDLTHAIRTVTLNPATAVGLADRGSIASGKRADLVRVSVVEGLPVVRSVWTEGRQTY
ncbi:amidohydrolase family protein [Rhizobium mayense]|uniref:Amidohydrolase family protein n=1 Tax=Rhizobium mayense TaxID=1312184 RepID=A0ABT7JUR0_9HYPH|nr:amidohydrolase family protein [Rhizobium mayense]MDL2400078.1 amidohydrolase family protein [Rhizobium mayense]